MRKRVFGSIFLTSLVTLMLTAGLFLLAVHAGLTRDLRSRLAKEAGYLASTFPPTAIFPTSARSACSAPTA